ncbi:hypothetical protein HDU93_008894 [Gonapodya sp. JEL0774]|nr:hypothetical protein HDU93_008894 [Gonapodya sp. JEL0774]
MTSPVGQSWEHLYPGPPEGFLLEPISVFYPLIIFVGLFAIGATYFLAKDKPLHDQVLMVYFVISVLIHFNLERYYAHYNHTILDPNNNDLMARIWRHYGISDTRCIILAYFNSPWRWAVQSAAVTAQAYGLFITWLPAVYENLQSVPKNDPVLFWGYFIGWQFPWALIPVLAVVQAGWETTKMFNRLNELEALVAKPKKKN